MKMTKIESARIVVKQKGSCVHVECKKCFTTREKCGCKKLVTISWTARKLALAEAYIKRHESKSKKKDHILDTTKKVTRPNFRKYLRDKIDMKVRVNPELSEELQKIAFEESVCWYTLGIVLSNITQPYLIFMNYENCYSIAWTDDSMHFQGDHRKEYNPETDTLVEKVEEPKPIKTVGIDNSDVTLALTAQHEPTPLEIAKMIRDNGYEFDCKYGETGCEECKALGFCVQSGYCSKTKIDTYISANEPCEPLASGMCSNPFDYCEEDCPANSEIPQPIKLPDFVYSASKNGVGFIDTKNRTFNTNDKGELLINDKPCFATPEEALQVAKKLWNGEGK